MYYNTYSTCVCVLYKNLMSHFAIFIQQRINWLCSTKALLNKFWPKKRGLSFSERFFFGSSKKILVILMGPSLGQRSGFGIEF